MRRRCARAAVAAAAATAAGGVAVPAWDYVPASEVKCVDASSVEPANKDNVRSVIYALPEGTPPAKGWPVYLHFVTDKFIPSGPTCGTPSRHGTKPFHAFATPNESLATCFGSETPPPTPVPPTPPPVPAACADAMQAACINATDHYYNCLACAKNVTACDTSDGTAWCTAHHHHHSGGCYYEQEAGAMWDQRLKQYLVSNGIAVVQVNPITDDEWEAIPEQWEGYTDSKGNKVGGADQPFLQTLFGHLTAGDFGPLDASKVVIRGWSGGAQLVSWLFEVFAVNGTTLFPGVSLAGGVMLSGGSYACYSDPQSDGYDGPPRQPVGSCKGCTEGGPSHCDGNDPLCSSCDPTVRTYCQQCCPTNFTEQYYATNPQAYSKHPPVFLAQTSKEDSHADLCACRNYHETLLAHGVQSTLVLVPEEDSACFCVGNPSEPAAAGSPYAEKCASPSWGQGCSTMGGPECCITHTLGFAAMVRPALDFVVNVTR